MNSLHLAVYTDVSFTKNFDKISQLGVLIFLRDKLEKFYIVTTSCTKSRRRARSASGAEMFGILDGFDMGYVIKIKLSKKVLRTVDFHVFTDSRSVYHFC